MELTPMGHSALQDSTILDRLAESPGASPSSKQPQSMPTMNETLFQSLRAWRSEQARTENIAAFAILHDSVLSAIATQLPVTLEALSRLKGVGPRKLEQYGQAVIELVRKHTLQ
jgi:superfamily II DNA helicase RecQ